MPLNLIPASTESTLHNLTLKTNHRRSHILEGEVSQKRPQSRFALTVPPIMPPFKSTTTQ